MALKNVRFVLHECLSLRHQITSRIVHSIYQDVKAFIRHSIQTLRLLVCRTVWEPASWEVIRRG